MRSSAAAGMALAVFSLGIAGCGGGMPSSSRADARRWLSVDAAARRATITLVAEYDASYNGFNLNGAAKGALLFAVPSGWQIVVRCVNNSSTRRYACALRPAPGETTRAAPALLGRPQPPDGLAPGAHVELSFTARAPARYRLAAFTEGHEPAGMWLALTIAPRGMPAARRIR